MKKRIVFLLIIVFLVCTLSVLPSLKQPTEQNSNQPFVFFFDNTDPSSFGFQFFNDDESIGPKSILISGHFAFIVDTYHSNIKKINLQTGEKAVSQTLGNKRAWLRDIIDFNDKLYILTDLANNYVLDNSLNYIKDIILKEGPKFGLKSEEEYLLIYSMGEVLYLNKADIIVKRITEDHNVFQTIRGKEFQINNDYITTEYGKGFHSGFYRPTWDYYDSINIDFNSSGIAFFVIDRNCLKLFFLRYV
jgi:hypothetical protein